MTIALAGAAIIALVAGFVLRVGAFAVFALMSCVFYAVLLVYQGGAIGVSLASVLVLLVILQAGYAIGVLMPFLLRRTVEWLSTGHSKATGRPFAPRDKTRGQTRRS